MIFVADNNDLYIIVLVRMDRVHSQCTHIRGNNMKVNEMDNNKKKNDCPVNIIIITYISIIVKQYESKRNG